MMIFFLLNFSTLKGQFVWCDNHSVHIFGLLPAALVIFLNTISSVNPTHGTYHSLQRINRWPHIIIPLQRYNPGFGSGVSFLVFALVLRSQITPTTAFSTAQSKKYHVNHSVFKASVENYNGCCRYPIAF